MIRYIHLSRSLIKKTKELRKSGGKGELIVDKFENILSKIKTNGLFNEEVTGKRTRKGEYRLRKCIKYDMGGGYRLITVRDGAHLFLPFLGTHDETDLWFEHHRNDNFVASDSSYQCESVSRKDVQSNSMAASSRTEEASADPYEDALQAQLDQTTLLSVFNGLCRQ